MVKLIFKAYNKSDKINIFIIFFLCMKMLTGYDQKNEESVSKKLAKATKVFLKKKKTKSGNILVSDTETSLKKKMKRNIYMVVNNIKIL